MIRSLNFRRRLALSFAAALLVLPASAFGQSNLPASDFGPSDRVTNDQMRSGPADSTRQPIRTSIKFYPSPIWSRTAGFSAGIGYEIDNLLMPRGRLLATAKPGQHLGRYTLTYFAKDAYRDRVYGLGNIYYETTGRHWYYGLGPASDTGDRMAVEKSMVEAELRIGVQPVNRSLLVQPLVRYVRHESAGFDEWDPGAVRRLDIESLRNLTFSAGETSPGRIQEGFAYGLVAGIDLLDRPRRPRRGLLVQGSMERFDFNSPEGLTFDRHGLYVHGFVPVREGVIAIRAVTILTNQRGSTTIPFFFLPSLHGRMLPGYSWDRFVGPDLLVVNVEYLYPLFNIFDMIGLDALLSVGAGNVYDDLFDQFKPDITFRDNMDPGQASYPLRPSVAAGFDIYRPSPRGFTFRVLAGLGTEGVRLVRFGFVHDLRDIELGKR